MGWKDVARLASGWAEAKKDELLTADRRTREDARFRADAIREQAEAEVGSSVLERVLPPELADRVTRARPENVAAREAEAAEREERDRLARLAASSESGATAELTLSVTGGEQGSIIVTLPCQRVEERPERTDAADGETAPLSWLRVLLETVTPVPVGTTTLAALSVAVPAFTGPGRYDLADLHRRGEAGEIGWWEPFEVYLSPVAESDESTWYVDVLAEGGVVVEVGPGSLTFDLPLASALSSIRATGTIRWAGAD